MPSMARLGFPPSTLFLAAGLLAVTFAAARQLRQLIGPDRALQQRHPVRESLGEPLLLLLQHALHMSLIACQLRKSRAHLALQHRHELVEERFLDT